MNPTYRVLTESVLKIEKVLNDLTWAGEWEPILMGTVPTSTEGQTPIAVTVILRKVQK